MNSGAFVESEIDLPGSATRLHCRVARPAGRAWAKLLIVHGYGEHAGRYLHFMRWMAGRGVACHALDLRGHGRSAGRRGFVRQWHEFLHDLQTFLDASAKGSENESSLPVFLLGHSHGGLIAAAAGERGMLGRAGIAGCVLASPYLATRVPPTAAKRAVARIANRLIPWLPVKSGLRREWLGADPEMVAEDEADELMNRSATPRWYFTMRREQFRVMDEAIAFRLPVLCLTGDADLIADPGAVTRFYERAMSRDKSLYNYPLRLHELLRDVGREKVFEDIFQWLDARAGH